VSRPEIPSSALAKSTLETRFFVDPEWWEESGRDLRLQIQQLCEEHAELTEEQIESKEMVDWIDPETGEVSVVDRLNYVFLSGCAQQPEFITERTSLIDAVFRALLATNNRPLTSVQLADRIGRPADMILRALSGRRIYKGIRPISDN
jgi:hypothetical protein